MVRRQLKPQAACATTLFCLCALPAAAQEPPGGKPEAVLYAAGDIAQCSRPGAERTAALLDGLPGTVLAVGDLAYPNGRAEDFARCYEPTWGRLKQRTLPVPGNHDYVTPQAAAYYAYFGKRAGEPGKGYYSVNLGSWHVVALNSNIALGPESEQIRWLREDLARNRQACVLAFWHHPRYASGHHGDDAAMATLWETLYQAGVSVAISGHDHNYERLAPLDSNRRRDDRRGIRSFVVGTGGARLYDFSMRDELSEAWNASEWGVLRLSLYPGEYAWEFLPVAGGSYHDAGKARCVSR